MPYSYTNTPHAAFPPAVNNQGRNVYPDHPHDVPDGITLPPMKPTSSSLFPAAVAYHDFLSQQSGHSRQVTQPVPSLLFLNTDKIVFESAHGRGDGVTIRDVLGNTTSSASAVAPPGARLMKVYFKFPNSGTKYKSFIIDHSQLPPAPSSAISVLIYLVTSELDRCAKHYYAPQALQQANWSNWRVLYLERIPRNDDSWELIYAAST